MTLEDLRKRLDKVDSRIIQNLAERFQITEEIGLLKATNKLPPQDVNRETQVFEHIERLAGENGLDVEIANRIYRSILDIVIHRHNELRDSYYGEDEPVS